MTTLSNTLPKKGTVIALNMQLNCNLNGLVLSSGSGPAQVAGLMKQSRVDLGAPLESLLPADPKLTNCHDWLPRHGMNVNKGSGKLNSQRVSGGWLFLILWIKWYSRAPYISPFRFVKTPGM